MQLFRPWLSLSTHSVQWKTNTAQRPTSCYFFFSNTLSDNTKSIPSIQLMTLSSWMYTQFRLFVIFHLSRKQVSSSIFELIRDCNVAHLPDVVFKGQTFRCSKDVSKCSIISRNFTASSWIQQMEMIIRKDEFIFLSLFSFPRAILYQGQRGKAKKNLIQICWHFIKILISLLFFLVRLFEIV